jgi:hypothetical protein
MEYWFIILLLRYGAFWFGQNNPALGTGLISQAHAPGRSLGSFGFVGIAPAGFPAGDFRFFTYPAL